MVSQMVSQILDKYAQFCLIFKRKPLSQRCEGGFCSILFDMCAQNRGTHWRSISVS